jgi:hypothetical protein
MFIKDRRFPFIRAPFEAHHVPRSAANGMNANNLVASNGCVGESFAVFGAAAPDAALSPGAACAWD